MGPLETFVGTPPPTQVVIRQRPHEGGGVTTHGSLGPPRAPSVEEFVQNGVDNRRARVDVDGPVAHVGQPINVPLVVAQSAFVNAPLVQFVEQVVQCGP